MNAPPPPLDYRPPEGPLRVIHRDADILVIDKPAGLLSVPGKGEGMADCAEARVRAAFPGALVVHRLDLATSGLLLFALNPRAQRILSGQFEKRIVRKLYEAEIWGAPTADSGRIDAPLRADWPNRPKQMIAPDGRRAVTDWEVIERRGAITRLRLRLLTGRSHQLRVHLAHGLGLPILGDPLYATGAALAARDALALRAVALSWRSPADGEWVTASLSSPRSDGQAHP
ncbi:MAG: RluA family pseudouridine synthase [Pikeienuella sp.]